MSPLRKSLIDAAELVITESIMGKKLTIPKKKKIEKIAIQALIILKKLPAKSTHIFLNNERDWNEPVLLLFKFLENIVSRPLILT